MFYKTLVKDHIRVSPELFSKDTKEAIREEIMMIRLVEDD